MAERTLSKADIEAITAALKENHHCRFENVTPDEMNFIKDLVAILKETRSEFIKWTVKGIIYAALIIVALASYFRFKG